MMGLVLLGAVSLGASIPNSKLSRAYNPFLGATREPQLARLGDSIRGEREV
jgi:hypothetical protein